MTDLNIVEMDCAELVSTLKAHGVVLTVEAGNLRLLGNRDVLGQPHVLDALRSKKVVLLDYLSETSGRRAVPQMLEPDLPGRHDRFPLTDVQRAYWVGRQDAFVHGNVAIHYYTEIELFNADPDRLEDAWNRTVRHHDMLRAVVDTDAMQQILPNVPHYDLPRTDLSNLAPDEQQKSLMLHREATSHNVHATDRWPGFALHLFDLGGGRFRLTYSQDLLHVDGGSLLLIIGDFCRHYSDPDWTKPLPRISFRDYVFYEIAMKESEAYRQGLAYWGEVVKELPPPPALPVAADNACETRFRRIEFSMPPEDWQEIRSQAAEMGITPTGWVMAAFAEIVSRWSGSEDLTLNVTLFNRPSLGEELLQIAGDFTSMLPVALRHLPGESPRERAVCMQRALWRHIEHRVVSGITVLNLLRTTRRDQDAASLSVVFTSLLNLSGQGFRPDGFSAIGEPGFTLTQTPQVTLDHQVAETSEGGIAFSWDFVEGHYPEGMIEDMFSAYRALVGRLVGNREAWNEALPVSLPDWQCRLVEATNQTGSDWPQHLTLRDLIITGTSRNPDQPAIATPATILRHGDLMNAATRLAARILAEGAEPGSRIGILMSKGWEQIVAVLAVHLAGCAYVPIDPTAPPARFRHIASDADLLLCLIDEEAAKGWKHQAIRAIRVDDNLLSGAVPSFTPARLKPEDASHVIYTSGSTGLPKGVLITHKNVVNRIHDILERFEIGPSDAALGLSALHHDLSVFDIFGVLAAGGTLVIPEEESRLDPAHWIALLRTHRVTLWNSVPAFAGMLAEYLADHSAEADDLSLRWMILAGDWIPVPLPDQLRRFFPDLDLVASGGPTETTIWDIWNRVGDVDPSWRSIPYGKPLSNAEYHILDRLGRRCPIWVPGEMYIGGAGVTAGYLNQHDLTGAKYVEVPDIAGRLFRSGDLGRMLPDGNIEFLGRNDFQVKIGGQRIELGEIERQALSVPGVRDSVTVIQQTARGPALVTFVTDAAGNRDEPDLDAQSAAFESRGITMTDPVERLEAKLEYAALVPENPAELMRLAPSPKCDHGLRSHREYAPGPITPVELGNLLAPLSGQRPAPATEAKFSYASAGGLYPVQVYLYLKPGAVVGMEPGIYRYFPLDHALECVSAGPLPDDLHWGYNRAWTNKAPVFIYLVADLTTIAAQYGDLAESMCLIEAGGMAQSLRHAAAETGFGTCMVGDISFPRTAERFRLHARQRFLLAMVAGPLPQTAGTDEGESLADRVQNHLEAVLPRHMVPQRIVVQPSLPLTANGKVDRKALMTMDIGEQNTQEYVDPSGEFEATVADTFANMLGISKISATDNFFDIGADSALLVKAYHAIKSKSGREFPLITMFKNPSVRRLSEHLSAPAGSARPAPIDDRAARQKAALKKLQAERKR